MSLPFRLLAGLLATLVATLVAPGVGVAGTVQTFTYTSAALGRPEMANVYLPDGQAPPGGWPTLYLLHGLNGSSGDWVTLGGIAGTLDRLIAAHRIKPLAVVMPDGGNSWYVDSAAVGGPGDYATIIGRELQAAVEAALPLTRLSEQRAIGGVSMGGYGALRLAALSPERYAAVALLSPAIWQNIPPATAGHDWNAPPQSYFLRVDPATVTIGVDVPPGGGHFGAAFGTPFDPRRFNAANVFTLMEADIEARKALPPVFLSVGDDDSHGLWRGAIALFEFMQLNKLDVDFRVTNGDHNWDLWKVSVEEALLFVDHQFTRPAIR